MRLAVRATSEHWTTMKTLLAFLCLLLVAALAVRAQGQEPAFRTVDKILAMVPLGLEGDLRKGVIGKVQIGKVSGVNGTDLTAVWDRKWQVKS